MIPLRNAQPAGVLPKGLREECEPLLRLGQRLPRALEDEMRNGRMRFDVGLGRPTGASRREDRDPFCILVLADLGGSAQPYAQRTPLRIDVDRFDAVFARVAPRRRLSIDGREVDVRFDSLEDFHPDRLFQRLAPCLALRQLRSDLGDPGRFRRAAAALGSTPDEPAPRAAALESDRGDIDRLLGRRPSPPPIPAKVVAGFDVEGWIRGIVTPHVVPDIADEQARLMAAVDLAIADQMRRVLHHPDFQALEANWRGIDRLVRELDDSIQLFVLDASRDALVQDIAACAGDLSQSVLHRHVCGPETQSPDGRRWGLLVSDLSVGANPEDLRLVAAVGAMGGRAGAPLLAEARPSLIGCARVGELGEPKSWKVQEDPDAAAFWSALRQSAVAPWIGLALPRILARLPYGKDSDPITAFSFEEMAVRGHEAYLWGSPAFALAQLAGQAFLDAGWNMDLSAGLDIADLPGHVYWQDGEQHQQPCAEVGISEGAGEAILERGVMAVLSYRNRNAARLLRWQSIADPLQPLRGPWAAA